MSRTGIAWTAIECDSCGGMIDVEFSNNKDWNQEIDTQLKNDGWIVTDEGDMCSECIREGGMTHVSKESI